MDTSWINTLLGGALAVAGGVASSWYQAKVARDGEARQLAKSIKGELSAIVEIADKRAYITGIEQAIQHIERTRIPYIMSVAVKRDYTIVYTQNAAKIGVLPGELPTQVAVVYTKLSAVLEDFALLYEVGNDPGRLGRYSADDCLALYRELLPLMTDTLAQARSVVSEIDAHYPRT